jgi:multidrug efflux pump subunit AcrB
MGDAETLLPWHALAIVLAAAIAISALLILLLRPLLLRYALARPNARSSQQRWPASGSASCSPAQALRPARLCSS